MVQKRRILIGLVLLLSFGVALAAGAQAKASGKKLDLKGEKLGIIFNIWDLAGDDSSSDGLSAGLGMKYWVGEKAAIRALLDFEHYRDSTADTTDTFFGLSGAFEYHFTKGKVSPYTGGLVGLRIRGGDASDLGLLLAGLFGVEVRVLDALGLFAEYSLSLFMNEPDTNIVLGAGNNAAIGVVVYLP
jgi:hypothetical protein